MTMIAFASVKHAPGVTTSVIGLARAWPRPVLVVEADPAGGDIAAWLTLPPTTGLLDAMLSLRRPNTDPSDVMWRQATALDAGGRLRLLAGLPDPQQAAAVDGMWPMLAQHLRGLVNEDREPVDVLIDCGRLSGTGSPWPLLAEADRVALVLRPVVAAVRLVSHWLPVIAERTADHDPGNTRMGLMIIGDKPYAPGEVTAALNVPLLGTLPDETGTAQQIAAGTSSRTLDRSRLWRSVTSLAAALAGTVAEPVRAPSATGSEAVKLAGKHREPVEVA